MWNFNQKFVKRSGSYLSVKNGLVLGLSLSLIIGLASFIPHPYHVSYTEINYKKETHNLTFVFEVFSDDLENAIKLDYKPEKFFLGSDSLPETTEILIQQYIKDKTTIIIDGIVLRDFKFLPSQSTPDRTTIYLELTDMPNFKSLAFYNEILTNIFLDQQNIIEFTYANKIEKALLTKEKTSVTWIIK